MAGEITIKLFASVREKLGRDELQVPLDSPVTAQALLEKLALEYPEVAGTLKSSRLSVNMAFASPNQTIDPHEKGEIAIIPPVSGG